MGKQENIITLPEEDKGWLESYGKAHNVSVSVYSRLNKTTNEHEFKNNNIS